MNFFVLVVMLIACLLVGAYGMRMYDNARLHTLRTHLARSQKYNEDITCAIDGLENSIYFGNSKAVEGCLKDIGKTEREYIEWLKAN